MTIWQWLAEPVAGTWSRVEVAWTVLALLGLLINTVKVWLVCGDLQAARGLRQIEKTSFAADRVLVALWTAANAVKDQFTLAAFVAIGYVAGQVPPQAVTVGSLSIAASAVSGLVLLAVELVTIAVVVFTLYARLRLSWRRHEGEHGRSPA